MSQNVHEHRHAHACQPLLALTLPPRELASKVFLCTSSCVFLHLLLRLSRTPHAGTASKINLLPHQPERCVCLFLTDRAISVSLPACIYVCFSFGSVEDTKLSTNKQHSLSHQNLICIRGVYACQTALPLSLSVSLIRTLTWAASEVASLIAAACSAGVIPARTPIFWTGMS